MRWRACWWSSSVPSGACLPREGAQGWSPPVSPTGGHALPIWTIHRFHLLEIGMVGHAIKQMNDPIWIQLEGRRFLPEPRGAGLVRLHKLRLGQLAGDQIQQLALLASRKAQILCTARGWVPAPRGLVFHRLSSWGQWCQPSLWPQREFQEGARPDLP